jgi:hypothetical protein
MACSPSTSPSFSSRATVAYGQIGSRVRRVSSSVNRVSSSSPQTHSAPFSARTSNVLATRAVYFYIRSGRRLIWLLGIPAFLTGAVASGSRGGLAALAVTLVVASPALLPGLRSQGGIKPVLLVAGLLGALVQRRIAVDVRGAITVSPILPD